MNALPAAASARVDALYQEACRALEAKSYAEVARCAAEAISLDATLPNPHFLLGTAELELGRFKSAEESFGASLALGAGFPMVLYAELLRAQARARGELATGKQPRAVPLDPATIRPVSIVICSIDDGRFARACDTYHRAFRDLPHEIVGIHDARSLCEGYNRGIRRATGELLVFSHDDIEIVAPDFAARLLSHLALFDLVGIAGTTQLLGPVWTNAGWPHTHGQVGYPSQTPGRIDVAAWHMRGAATPDAAALDGCFLAARRELLDDLAFDEQTFDGWHMYDIDFTFSAHLRGYRSAVCHDLCLIHHSGGRIGEEWRRYARRFADKHREWLPPGEPPEIPQVCSVVANSAAEWLLMTEAITSQSTS